LTTYIPDTSVTHAQVDFDPLIQPASIGPADSDVILIGYVLSCHLRFLSGDSHPKQVLVDCAPPVCIWASLKPRNLPVERLCLCRVTTSGVCAGDPFIDTVLSSSDSDLFVCYCPSSKCPRSAVQVQGEGPDQGVWGTI